MEQGKKGSVAEPAPPSALTTEPKAGSGAMFDLIAKRYDTLNRILSMGLDQGWRRKTVASLALKPGARVLDLATGTADLAIQIAREQTRPSVVGLDPSENMLAVGREKVAAAKLGIELIQGDAQSLPFEDSSFDGVSIAFGIRNVPDRPKALREMARVVKPGGRIAILELSEPKKGLLGPMARLYIRQVVPWLGALLSGAKEYRYLQRSIAAFPPPEEFARTMEASSLRVLDVHPLTFGVAVLYVATPSKP